VADALRWLRTSGLVAERDGVWQLTASLSSVQVDIPASIRSMIQRKFEQLTDGDRRLLAAASIQGTDFDSAVVSIVAGLAADEVEERLDALEHVYGLVRHVAVHDLPDGTLNVRYRFVHAMYQNALYASLTPTRKVALSARAAQALATHHDALSADIALPLALLYEAAREPARAVDQFLVAARRAARLFAMEESLALADRALALTMSLSLSADRDRRTMRAEELRAAALSALRGLGDVEVVAAGQRALALWQALDRPLADASIPMAIVGSLIVTGQFTVAAAMADEMVAYAEAANDRVLFAAAACNGGIARVHRGDWRDAERLLSRGLTAYDPAHPEAYVDFLLEPGVYMYAERARARWVLGHPDAARADARAAMDLAERVPHREARAFAPLFAAYVEEFCGNALGVRAHAERILTLARERDITTILPWALMLDGWSSAVLDGHDDGLARLRESLALQLSIGLLVDRPRFLGLEVDVLLRRHRFDEACAQADQALAVANRTGNHCWDSDLHRQRAIALHGVGAPADDIDATLALARTVADEQGAVSLRLRAAVTGRELWMQRAEPRRGVDDLTAALAVVTEGADTADLQRARALRAAAAP
jgi:adenylate cyclase